MGKKKAFIDKKRATTYSLVFRSAEDLEEPENAEADRVLVPAGEFGGGTKEDQPPSDPRALYAHFFGNEDYEQEEMTEARRRELLEYGFPDDGYDYLKHCRVIGRGSAAMHAHQIAAAAAADPSAPSSSAAAAAAAEPSQAVFLKAPRVKAPRADVKLVDARGVAVAAAIAAATAAEVMPAPAPVLAVDSEAAAPAAAKRIGGRELAAELLELEQLMDAAEAASEPEEADEQGLGDLLDDFVLTAAAGAAVDTGIVAAAAAAPGSTRQQQQQQFDFSDEDEEFSSELSDDEEQQQQHNRMAVAGSSGPAATAVAGSGKAAYDMLNEQFDHLMSAYDDEQLGDLEGDARAAGKLRPDQLQALIAQGQQQQQQRLGPARAAANGEFQSGDADDDYEENDKFLVDETTGVGFKGRKIGGLGFESKVESLAEKDDEVIAAVRARLAAQEATANSSSKKGAAGGILEDEELQTMYMPAERERWDCESVLSLRSNISHFPAKIASEAGGRRRGGSGAVAAAAAAGGSGVIKLNAKTGLPSGYGAASMAAAAAAAAASAAAAAGAQQQRLTSAAVAAAAAAAGNDADSEGPAAQGFDNCSTATSIYERLKGETAEERKARKAAVKAVQRDARATKKELKKMYASEASRQQRQQAAAPKAAVIPIP